MLYGTGTGVAKDEEQARKLFQRAAEAGNPRGVSNLAALGGVGAPSDPARLRELLGLFNVSRLFASPVGFFGFFSDLGEQPRIVDR